MLALQYFQIKVLSVDSYVKGELVTNGTKTWQKVVQSFVLEKFVALKGFS